MELVAAVDADYDVLVTALNGAVGFGPDNTVQYGAPGTTSFMATPTQSAPLSLRLKVGDSLWCIAQNSGEIVTVFAQPC